MRPRASKLRRHKHDPVPTRPFKRELQRLISAELRGFNLPLTHEFLTHIRAQVKDRFTK